MADDITRVIENTEIDAQSLQEYVNETNPNAMVERRLAPPVHPLQFWENYFQTLADTGTTTQLQNVEIDVNRETADKYTPRNILFVGDSLTENITDGAYTTPRDSYALIMSDMLASASGGFKQLGYVGLTTQNIKDFKGQVSLTRSGFTDMWGASDHKWNQLPFSYSPDGRGFYTENSSTTDSIFINTIGLITATKLRLYYLKQPDGGLFRFGYSSVAAADRLLVDTSATTTSLGVVEIEVESSNLSERIIISSGSNSTKLAFYGVEIIDDNNSGGITSNYFARSGSMLSEHNQLQAMATYYSNLNPDTVFINIGTNDALVDTSRATAAEFQAQFVIWMDRFRGACPDARVYIVEPNISAVYGKDPNGDGEGLLLESYTQVRKDIAAAYANTIYVDVPKIAGDYNYFATSDFMADILHPNAYGKYHIARKIMKFMSLDIAPELKYRTSVLDSKSSYTLTTKSKVQDVSAVPIVLAKYGLVGTGVNAYFDIKVSASVSGKTWVNRLRFYAPKTVQSGNQVLDVRGVVDSVEYRVDATSSLTNLQLSAIKNADGVIEIKAALSGGNNPTATEWTLSGTVVAASSGYLVEM